MALNPTDTVIVAPASNDTSASYLDWSPILGGAVLAAAISTILAAFGSAIGLSMVSADTTRSSGLAALAVAGGLWALWVTISACGAGGYLAGRMRRPSLDSTDHERHVRDGAHGLVVWAVGALLVAFITSSTITGAAKTAATGVASAAAGVGALISQQADPVASSLDTMLRTTGTEPISASEREEASRVLVRSVANGSVDAADRSYVASRIAARSNISQQEAEKRIDDAFARLNQAKEAAKQAAERTRKMAIVTAFLTAAALLAGAAAAWFAAVLGGKHRDDETDLTSLFGPR
ncbi:hypothetical protein [Bosea sp. NPDC055594]